MKLSIDLTDWSDGDIEALISLCKSVNTPMKRGVEPEKVVKRALPPLAIPNHRRHWTTEEDDRLIAGVVDLVPYRVLAKQMGRTTQSLKKRISVLRGTG